GRAPYRARTAGQLRVRATETTTPAAGPLASPGATVRVLVAIPDRIAEIDVILVGERAGRTTRGTAKQSAAEDVAARHAAGRRARSRADAGTGQATFRPGLTTRGEPDTEHKGHYGQAEHVKPSSVPCAANAPGRPIVPSSPSIHCRLAPERPGKTTARLAGKAAAPISGKGPKSLAARGYPW